MPVAALAELQRYQELVRAAAELEWEKEHPGEGLPSDFDESFSLVLKDIKPGSATSVLESRKSAYEPYFERGRSELEREIAVIEQWLDDSNPQAVSPQPLDLPLLDQPEFLALGSSISDAASFSISADRGRRIEITPTLRNRGIRPLAARRAEALTPAAQEIAFEKTSEFGEVAGHLVQLDAETRSFKLVPLRYGGHKISGRYKSDTLTPELREHLDSPEKRTIVRLKGTLRYHGTKLARLLQTSEVNALTLDSKPWSRRFIELATLEEGWSEDGEGKPIDFLALDAAREILEAVLESQRSLPGIFPMVDGGVQLEWSSPDFVTNIEISPGLSFYLFDLAVDSLSSTSVETDDLAKAKSFVRETSR